jgi:hypothetical protein
MPAATAGGRHAGSPCGGRFSTGLGVEDAACRIDCPRRVRHRRGGPLRLLAAAHRGLQVWFDRLIGVTAAFYLLQNRARAAGMKSEVCVLVVIATGSIGLLLMLARTLHLERRTPDKPWRAAATLPPGPR